MRTMRTIGFVFTFLALAAYRKVLMVSAASILSGETHATLMCNWIIKTFFNVRSALQTVSPKLTTHPKNHSTLAMCNLSALNTLFIVGTNRNSLILLTNGVAKLQRACLQPNAPSASFRFQIDYQLKALLMCYLGTEKLRY